MAKDNFFCITDVFNGRGQKESQLFQAASSLTIETIGACTKSIGIDPESFNSCYYFRYSGFCS
jgi:hypothetical protein